MQIYELDPLIRPLEDNMHYGSIERVGIALNRELLLKGIGSTLIALVGSNDVTKSGNLVQVNTHEEQISAVLNDELPNSIAHVHRSAVLESQQWQVNHKKFLTVCTLHGPAEKIRERYEKYKDMDVSFTVLSSSQMDIADYGFNIVAQISNGVNTNLFVPKSEMEPSFMSSIGRICPDKNQYDAIRACLATGKKLVIAGPIQDAAYYRRSVKPYVDGKHIVFVNNASQSVVKDILEKTEALLMPVNWKDPCPLVALEAQSMGVPVLGYARGGLVDQVEEGLAGHLVNSFDEFVDTFTEVSNFDREKIRKNAINKFDWSVIINKYIDVFKLLTT